MGFTFTDSFSGYAASADLLKKWATAASPWTYNATAGRNGAGGVTCAAGSGAAALSAPNGIVSSGQSGIYHIGLYFKFSAAPSNVATFLTWNTVASGSVNLMNVNTDGTLRYFVTASSGAKNVCDNQWHWVEMKVNIANANNLTVAYVDGVIDFSSSIINPIGNSALTSFQFARNNLAMSINGLSHVVLYDNNGNHPVDADFPLGALDYVRLDMASDAGPNAFTPDTPGSHFSRLNETVPDGDTSYLQSGNSGDKDLFGITSLSSSPSVIHGTMLNAYVENPNAGSINFQQICKSGATESDGAVTAAPASYATKQQEFGNDPATGSKWTQSALNAATFGAGVA